MHATSNAPGAWGQIELGYPDAQGNWPMLVTVRGLEPLPEGGYYELLLTRDGEPVATCGSFKVEGRGATTVRLGASYDLSNFDGWVVRPYIHDRDKFNQLIFLRDLGRDAPARDERLVRDGHPLREEAARPRPRSGGSRAARSRRRAARRSSSAPAR